MSSELDSEWGSTQRADLPAGMVEQFVDALCEHLYEHDFNSLMRRVEAQLTEYPRLGTARQAQDDPVRFKQDPSLAFAPSTIRAIEYDATAEKINIEQAFFGLLGPNGPMPHHISEYINERSRHYQDHTWRAFVDLFHQRILSLYYRIWAASEPVTYLDRPERDSFTYYLSALVGVGDSVSAASQNAFPNDAVQGTLKSLPRALAGLYAQGVPTADNLAAIIGHYLALPVRIEEFTGDWLALDESYQLRLGDVVPLTGAQALGERVYNRTTEFTVVIGPVSHDDYLALKPGGEALESVNRIIKDYIGFEYQWRFRVLLDVTSVKEVTLSAAGEQQQLGWNSWLGGAEAALANAGQNFQSVEFKVSK